MNEEAVNVGLKDFSTNYHIFVLLSTNQMYFRAKTKKFVMAHDKLEKLRK